MIKSALLHACACVLLAASSLAAMNKIPIKQYDKNDPPPLCPLSHTERTALDKLLFREYDADATLLQPFTELWSSRFHQAKVPYCLKTYVRRTVEDTVLKQISVVKNVNTNDQEEKITYLEKIEPNVFLVRNAGDLKAIARIYLIFVDTNALVLFQCSIEPVRFAKLIFRRFYNSASVLQDQTLPDNYPLPKMAILSIPQISVPFINRVPSIKKSLDAAKKLIKENGDLFGHTAEVEPCVLGEGDIENGQV